MILAIETEFRTIEIEMHQLTWITSKNVSELNYLSELFNSYFLMGEQPYLEFRLNHEIISNKHFELLLINSLFDLNQMLANKKGLPLYNYSKEIMSKIKIQDYLDQMDIIYEKIINEINENHIPYNDINCHHNALNHQFLLDKNLEIKVDTRADVLIKIEYLIQLIHNQQMLNGKKYVIYLNNIDSYIDLKDVACFIELVNSLTNENICIMITTTNSRYLCFSEPENINIINNLSTTQLPNMYVLLDKVNKNVNSNITYNEQQIIYALEHYLHHVFEDEQLPCFDIIKAIKAKPSKKEKKKQVNGENTIYI